jgi:DNA-binding response OmpR family regulator
MSRESSHQDGARREEAVLVAGDIRLALDSRELRLGERTVVLAAEPCQLLRILVEQRGQVVTRTTLMMAIWGAASADRAALLEGHVAALRAAVGRGLHIETITGIGYRLH